MIIRVIKITTALFAFSFNATAQTQISSFFSLYQDDNNLSVVTPTMRISHDVRSDLNLSLSYSFERFDKEAPSNADQADVVVGASTVAGGVGTGFEETRNELNLTTLYTSQIGRLGAGFHISDEDDFSSNGLSLSWSQDFAQKNFTLTTLFGINQDKIYSLNNTNDFPKIKDVVSLSMGFNQLMTSRLFVYGGIGLFQINGYQSSPLRSILTEQQVGNGTIKVAADENHPDDRQRMSVFTGVKQYYLNRSAVDTTLSLYDDSWGVFANAVRLSYYQYLNDQTWMRLRLQYYSQTQANFYKPVYSSVENIMTADNRLRDYDAKMLGIKLAYKLRRKRLRDWEISAAYDWYAETNQGISADIFKIMFKTVY